MSETRPPSRSTTRKSNRRRAKSSSPGISNDQIQRAAALCSVESRAIGDFQRRKALKQVLDLERVQKKKTCNPVNFRGAPMVTTFIRSVGDRTRDVWKFLETVCQTDTGVRLAKLQHSSLNQMLNNYAKSVPIYVHASLYRSLKVRFPLDVGRLSREGRVPLKSAPAP